MSPLSWLRALLTTALLLSAPALASAQTLQTQVVRDAAGQAMEAYIWTPDAPSDRPRPLVVISHGNGGSGLGHADTAQALARAGFVVAAITHPGDNFRDMSRSLRLTDRAPQISALITYMTDDWQAADTLDKDRIGAFGLSAGGFTVASLMGGVSDAQAINRHCSEHPDFFVCTLIGPGGIDPATWTPGGYDPRIKAAVLAAPGFGFSFTDESLGRVRIPVQLWQAGEDEILPSPYHVESLRDRLPGTPDYHLVPGASHHDFLPPCSPEMKATAPTICRSNEGFDRAAFKLEFNSQVVAFFERALSSR